jgi:two-component system, chemotaxis family, sensor kinase CheA
MLDRFKESFREEAYELLNNLEQSLLELEDDPTNNEEISAVFRAMHTVKGSAAMFGFQQISDFAHHIENMLEYVRDGRIPVSQTVIDLTLQSRDHIRLLLESGEDVPPEIREESQTLIDKFKVHLDAELNKGMPQGDPVPGEAPGDLGNIGGSGSSPGVGDTEGSQNLSPEAGHYVTYRIRFKPPENIYLTGTNPLLLLEELKAMGEYTCVPAVDRIPPLSQLNPEACLIQWDIILSTQQSQQAVRDVFIFVEDIAEIEIVPIDDLTDLEEGPYKRLGQILEERGALDSNTLNTTVQKQKRLGQMLVEEGLPEHEVEAALREQEHVKRSRERAHQELSSSSIRVESSKLDHLVDLVGEVVTLQARLSQTATDAEIPQLTAISETFERLTDELRDSTMSIRMLPIGTTFSKFRRLVRDLSQDLGKQIEMRTEGGETELDKTVIERLSDPLVHLIRNSIDHGIETPAAREAAGKERGGVVLLKAEHSGASVIITIQDDGKGLNRESILQKAVDKGLVPQGTELTDEDVYQLIFAPGFSTAENVTQVSGRGVGMDVVRKEIDSLGGSVTVKSEAGKGTTLTLAIPLTLAIIDGLLVRIGEEHFVFPLGSVSECLELTTESRNKQNGQRILNNRGEVLPFVRLRELFIMDNELPPIEQIVVAESPSGKIGFVVDQVIGDFQTVIKNLGKLYRDLEGISGATILGDGSVALILDVTRLTSMSQVEEVVASKGA